MGGTFGRNHLHSISLLTPLYGLLHSRISCRPFPLLYTLIWSGQSKHTNSMSTRRRKSVIAACALLGILIVVPTALAYRISLESPPNILWALSSGYYRYDPRRQTPPADLFRDRPELSLTYFLEATLKRCGGTYPLLSPAQVTQYVVEQVDYFGHTDYHAFSDLHTRIFFSDGTSGRVVFRFEAGHNESYPLYLGDVSTIRAGGWMALGGLLRDPDRAPPGWSTYDPDPQPTVCNPTSPYAIEQTP